MVAESVRFDTMTPTKEFLSTDHNIYHKIWTPSSWKVLQWGLRQVGLAGIGSYEGTVGTRKLKAAAFVVVGALEKVATQVLASREKAGQSFTHRTLSGEAFTQELATLRGTEVPEEDVKLQLRYLERDKQALSYDDKVRGEIILSPYTTYADNYIF